MNVEIESNHGALIPSVQMDRVLAVRAKILHLIEQGLRQLLAADELAVSEGFGGNWKAIRESFYEMDRCPSWDDPCKLNGDANPIQRQMEFIEAVVDARGWNYLMWQSGIRTFMDAASRMEWDSLVKKRETPTLNMDNIQATFQRLYEERGVMVERGVVQLFRGLSWNYKSNAPMKFGKRLVLKGAFNARVKQWRGPDEWWIDCRSTRNQLDDLVRQLRYFDGLPEDDHRISTGTWVEKPDTTGAPWEPYFELRRFNNGNAHVLFKRMDLVDKLNGILAKHYPGALPPPTGVKS